MHKADLKEGYTQKKTRGLTFNNGQHLHILLIRLHLKFDSDHQMKPNG